MGLYHSLGSSLVKIAPMSAAILFSALAPDVILSIFACCDIFTVVSIGRTCQYLHSLAFQKSVWLDLLADLKRRLILESGTPDLSELSTDELINLVKRLLYGPDTWTPSDGGFTPEVSKEITLHPTIPNGPGVLDWENEAKLFQSGRYVLFNNWRVLECWSVVEDRLVWKHTSTIDSASVVAFAAEERHDLDSIILMICQRTFPQNGTRTNYVEIVELDVQKGTHDVLLICRAPDTDYDNPFSDPAICGALAIVASPGDGFLIIDWKAKTSFVLKCTPDWRSLIALIPQHTIFKTVSPGGEYQLHLISDDVLRLGVASPELNEPVVFTEVLESQIPKLLTHRIAPSPLSPPVNGPLGWTLFEQMSARESPLRKGTYRIWFYMSKKKNHKSPDPFSTALCSYDITISRGNPPRWRERARAPALPQMYYRGITYSGHTQVFDAHGVRNEQILPPALTAASGEVDLGDHGDFVDVAAYSGALTYATPETIVILYFK
ncbi:hypothetical protein DFH09DRAFT_1158964 [Mycena vulgaris]|nr:hypothetical protein DFH09DRAFT_1158964 [Mycena vulgaris]